MEERGEDEYAMQEGHVARIDLRVGDVFKLAWMLLVASVVTYAIIYVPAAVIVAIGAAIFGGS